MNSNTSLATKYRPRTFSEVVGQDSAVSVLKKFASDSVGIPVRSIFLKGSWGSGKCIRGSQRISTENGYLPIKELLPDAQDGFTEFVIGVEQSDHSFADTSHFYKESNADLFTLTLESGSKVSGTANHPIMSVLADRNSSVCFRKVGDLSIGDSVIRQRACSLYPYIQYNEALKDLYDLHGADISGNLHFASKSSAFFYLWGLLSTYSVMYSEKDVQYSQILVQYPEKRIVMDLLEYLQLMYVSTEHDIVIDAQSTKLVIEVMERFRRQYPLLESCFTYKEVPVFPDEVLSFKEDRIVAVEHTKEDVYDVSVPTTHEFISCSVVNHNTTLSRIFAKAMNCEHFKEKDDVCNDCPKCEEVSSKNSRLYYEFDSAAVGNVDTIRNFPTLFGYNPNGRRVVVLDECHAVSNAAATALLKIIEDGLPNTIFVFCSTEDILPTLKSRSIVLDINPIPIDLIKDRVRFVANSEGISITEEDLDVLAIKSNGHMRDALSILQLYSVAGQSAISTSLKALQRLIIDATSKKPYKDTLIQEVLKYPVLDIKRSFQLILKDSYNLNKKDSFYVFLRQRRINQELFMLLNADYVKNAMLDEVGMEIFLNYLYEKF